METNKAGLVWIVLISFLSILTLTFSSPIPVYTTEDVLTLQSGCAPHFVETDDGLLSMQRRGLSGKAPSQSSSTFKNGVGAMGRAISRAGQAIRTQISRVGTYARGAANPTHTGANFANYAAKKDQNQFFKRGALDATNNAIDYAQAKAQRAHDKVSGVKHVLGNHFGMSSLKHDIHAAWNPENAAGGSHHRKRDLSIMASVKKRGLNSKIDHAQASVTNFSDKVHGVKEVVKDHAKNNDLVRDLHSAWHPEEHKKHKRSLNEKIDRAQASVTGFNDRRHAVASVVKGHVSNNALVQDLKGAWNNPHHKREAISIDQFLGGKRSKILTKRDIIDSTNHVIDHAEGEITDARDKVHAVKHVVGQHIKNEPLVNDVKNAWDTGDADM